jgi:glycosidase
MKIILTSFLLIGFVMNMAEAQDKKTDKIAVYQVFTRLFGNQNTTNSFNGSLEQNGTGKFDDINDPALKSLFELGITHVWYTGVIEHATMTDFSQFGIKKDHPDVVKGIAGSPYAIKDYYDVNPYLANDVNNRMQEFENLVKRTHKNNLKVFIDFVPNHVARQYHSDVKPKNIKDFGEDDILNVHFSPQNNYYYINESFKIPPGVNSPVKTNFAYEEFPAKATGNDVFSASPSINDWFETIKLNYGVDYLNNKTKHFDPIPDTWFKMKDILLYWANKGVDGFRCDMAEMVPVEFWEWVITEVKSQYPEVKFVAEIYNPNEYRNYIFKGKFDYLYDKVGLYDALRRLIEGHGNATDITKVWQQESGDFSEHMLRFLENHDEQRIASNEFGKNPESALGSWMLSTTLHTGPLMVYMGQELGVKPDRAEGFQGNDGRTTIFDFWGLPELQGWINGGKYSEKGLTKSQKKLREFYKNSIWFARNNEAISNGKFHDLQYLNGWGKAPGYNQDKVYSYIRFTNNQMLLFIYNFDLNNGSNSVLNLPQELIESKYTKKNNLILREVFTGKEKIKIPKGQDLTIRLDKNSFKIYEIK